MGDRWSASLIVGGMLVFGALSLIAIARRDGDMLWAAGGLTLFFVIMGSLALCEIYESRQRGESEEGK